MKINRTKLTFYSEIIMVILGVIIIELYLIDKKNDALDSISQIFSYLGFLIVGFVISSYFDFY